MKKTTLLGIAALLILMGSGLIHGAGKTEKKPEPASPGVSGSEGKLEKWPLGSLTIVVPYTAGGTNDRQARALAPYIQKVLGVPIKIENRPGGSTTVGYGTHLEKDPDDGSYIIYGHHITFCTAVLRGAYKYDDFISLGSMSNGHPVIMVNPKHSDVKDFRDFLQKVKSNPNQYSQPAGRGWGRVFDLILKKEGLKTRLIPVEGGSSDRVLFLAGDVNFYISDYESSAAIFDPTEFKVLAIFSETSPYKGFLTANSVMAELGYSARFPTMLTPRYFHVKKAFKEKYPERFEFLSNVLIKAAKDPEFVEAMKKTGYIFDPRPLDEVDAMFREIFETIKAYKDAF